MRNPWMWPWVLLCLCSSAAAQTLAVQMVDPAGRGMVMGPTGSIAGHRLVYPCSVPGQCAPRRDASVWTAKGSRLALPGAAGSVVVLPAAIGDGDVVAGTLSDSATTATAGVWRQSGGTYVFEALGRLGLEQSWATGIDAAGRVVGYATTPFVQTLPFVWTAAGGQVDLHALGAPAERIHAVSPGGRAVTDAHSYLLQPPAQARCHQREHPGHRKNTPFFGSQL